MPQAIKYLEVFLECEQYWLSTVEHISRWTLLYFVDLGNIGFELPPEIIKLLNVKR